MTSNIGVPTKLLQESLGHVITVELKTGQVYRGKLFEGLSKLCESYMVDELTLLWLADM